MNEPTKAIKQRDRYAITFTASQDLDGATVRLLHKILDSWGDGTTLALVDDHPTGPTVTHHLDGTLVKGKSYAIVLEATWPAVGDDPPTIITFPTHPDGGPSHIVFTIEDDIA